MAKINIVRLLAWSWWRCNTAAGSSFLAPWCKGRFQAFHVHLQRTKPSEFPVRCWTNI